MLNNSLPRWVLAVCYRSGFISLALFDEGKLIEARVTRLRNQQTKLRSIRSHIQTLALDYAVDLVVLEPVSDIASIVRGIGLATAPLTLREAKCRLLPEHHRPSHRQLYDHLTQEGQPFRRLVNINPKNDNLITQSWRLMSLLSVALGLAAMNKPPVDPSTSIPSTSPSSSISNLRSYVPSKSSPVRRRTHQARETAPDPQ